MHAAGGNAKHVAAACLFGLLVAVIQATPCPAADQGDPKSESEAVLEIRQLLAESPTTRSDEGYLMAVSRRRSLILDRIDKLLRRFPETKYRDELLVGKLESMYVLAVTRALPLDDVRREAERVLAGRPSKALAAYAAYLAMQIEIAEHRKARRRRALTTTRDSTTTRASAEPGPFALRQYAKYIREHASSRYAPPLLAALVQEAWSAGKQKQAARYLSLLTTHHPRHVETERILAGHRMRETIGKPLRLRLETTARSVIELRQLRGNVVLLVFWATWDRASRAALPELKRLQERYASEGLHIIGVSLDDSASTVEEYARRHDLTWPQCLEPRHWASELVRRLGVQALPAIWVIDREGIVRAVSPPALGELVGRLLGSPTESPASRPGDGRQTSIRSSPAASSAPNE